MEHFFKFSFKGGIFLYKTFHQLVSAHKNRRVWIIEHTRETYLGARIIVQANHDKIRYKLTCLTDL